MQPLKAGTCLIVEVSKEEFTIGLISVRMAKKELQSFPVWYFRNLIN